MTLDEAVETAQEFLASYILARHCFTPLEVWERMGEDDEADGSLIVFNLYRVEPSETSPDVIEVTFTHGRAIAADDPRGLQLAQECLEALRHEHPSILRYRITATLLAL